MAATGPQGTRRNSEELAHAVTKDVASASHAARSDSVNFFLIKINSIGIGIGTLSVVVYLLCGFRPRHHA